MSAPSNYERTNTKFFVTLNAIIEGIYCDVSLNKDEMIFLDTWLLELQSSIYFTDHAKHIYHITKNFTESILALDEAELNEETRNKALEYLENIQDEIAEISEELIETYYSDSELLINFLQGLCKGLIADGRIEQEEIECLYNYLVDYSGYLSREPMCQIFYETFKDVDLDNISSNQKAKIKALITDFSGCDNQGSVDGLSIGSSFFDTVEDLDLSGKIIQLTGRFKYGTRSKCKALAESQGAIVLDDWRMDIDYLIVGNSNSRDWIYQSYGRKIERAKEYQVKQNHKVKIITEEQWIVEV